MNCPKCDERLVGGLKCQHCGAVAVRKSDFSLRRVVAGFCIILPLMIGLSAMMSNSPKSADDAKTEAAYKAMASIPSSPPVIPPPTTPSPSDGSLSQADVATNGPDPDVDLKLLSRRAFTDDYGGKYITGKIKNVSNFDYDYGEIDIDLYDKHHDKIGDAMTNTTHWGTGETWVYKANVLEDETRSYRVVKVTGTPTH